MNGFDPGTGWHDIGNGAVLDPDAELITYRNGDTVHAWVREDPVPALPAAPYTVIRVDWRKDDRTHDGWPRLLIFDGDTWEGIERPHTFVTPFLSERITRFEVLAEPRAVTAKAVLDRVCEHIPTYGDKDRMWDIAREFGVSS